MPMIANINSEKTENNLHEYLRKKDQISYCKQELYAIPLT